MNILNIYQGGLFLGQKEYYLDNDSATAGIRDAYKKHIIRMFQFFGFDKKSATKKMENIMKIETALAKVSKSRAELRDVAANYNKMTIEDFESNYPAIKLSAYMSKLDVDNSCFKELVVGQPVTEYVAETAGGLVVVFAHENASCSGKQNFSNFFRKNT